MNMRLIGVAAAGLLLAACAGQPVRPELSAAEVAAAENAQRIREHALAALPAWSLAGRVAVSNHGKGGSGRIEWRQDGAQFRVSLSAPVTRQSWQLVGTPGQAQLDGVDGGPRSGPDARLLLLEATGWDIPVEALGAWLRGTRAPSLGPARVEYGADGLPWRIEQGGWSIQFQWPQPEEPVPGDTGQASDPATAPRLPSRIDASRDQARVKLIVDQWVVDAWSVDPWSGT